MIVGTAGHIDHGKSALVRALTGVDPDRLKEEKARGISIDLGFAYMPAENGATIGFVDAPGHEKFVRNMLAGATGIDFVLLVVAADDGVMPQTREHLAILDLLGATRGVVALTKADLASRERLETVTAELRATLAKTSLASAEIIAVSTITGEGLPLLRARLNAASATYVARTGSGRFRLAVDRSFALTGAGTIVTGTVLSGAVETGDVVTVSPSGLAARVRSIHAMNKVAKRGVAGERCALNLSGDGVRKDAIRRGDMVIDPTLHAPADRIDATLRVLNTEPRAVSHWMPARLHHGCVEAPARLALLDDAPIGPGESGRVQLVLERPIAAAVGDRFILRDVSGARTIGGGALLDLRAPARRRKTPQRRAQLDALEITCVGDCLAALLDCPPYFVDLAVFARDRAMTAKELDEVAGPCAKARAGDEEFAFSARTWASLATNVTKAIAALHASQPEARGAQPEFLRKNVEPRLPAPVFAAVLDMLATSRVIAFEGGAVRLPDHRIDLSPRDAQLWRTIESMLSGEERFRPPRGKEIADLLRAPEADVRRVLKTLTRQKVTLEIAPDHFFLRATAAEMTDIAADIAGQAPDGWFGAALFRDRLDNGRKVAIQILEFFDRQAVTIRRGDLRRVNKQRLDLFRR